VKKVKREKRGRKRGGGGKPITVTRFDQGGGRTQKKEERGEKGKGPDAYPGAHKRGEKQRKSFHKGGIREPYKKRAPFFPTFTYYGGKGGD